MLYLKKLIFLPAFALSLSLFLYFASPLTTSFETVFSLSVQTLLPIIWAAILLNLAAFFFVLFATFALDWKIILPSALVSSLLPFFFFAAPYSLFLSLGLLVTQIITFVSLENSLKLYYTFNPMGIFTPLLKRFILLTLLSLSAIYFISTTNELQTKGFTIPDELLETALNFAPGLSESADPTTQPQAPQVQLTPEVIDLVKQNPELLAQYGIDPTILDSINTEALTNTAPQNITKELTKNLIKEQFDKMISPFLAFLPPVLTLLFFISIQSITSLLGLLIPPLFWLAFYIFEKTGIIKFVVEQRPVKKMVIE